MPVGRRGHRCDSIRYDPSSRRGQRSSKAVRSHLVYFGRVSCEIRLLQSRFAGKRHIVSLVVVVGWCALREPLMQAAGCGSSTSMHTATPRLPCARLGGYVGFGAESALRGGQMVPYMKGPASLRAFCFLKIGSRTAHLVLYGTSLPIADMGRTFSSCFAADCFGSPSNVPFIARPSSTPRLRPWSVEWPSGAVRQRLGRY